MYLKRHGGENMKKLISFFKEQKALVIFVGVVIIIFGVGIFQKYEDNNVSWEVLDDEGGMFSKVKNGKEVGEMYRVLEYIDNSDWHEDKKADCKHGGRKSAIAIVDGEEVTVIWKTPPEHEYSEWEVVKEAKCNEEGEEQRTCVKCGKKDTKNIDKTAHSLGEWKITKKATCNSAGEQEAQCEICGEKFPEEIDKLKHKWSTLKIIKNATQTRLGKKKIICSICGKKKVVDLDLPKSYDEGMHRVGKDIPAGKYILYAEYDSSAYFAILKDSSGNFDSIIVNDNFYGNSIVDVKKGEYLELSGCEAVPAKEGVGVDTNGEGMFRVGVDIEPGEYKLVSGGKHGYYCVYPNARHRDILHNDNFNGSAYVTVSNGQYLLLSNCKIKK